MTVNILSFSPFINISRYFGVVEIKIIIALFIGLMLYSISGYADPKKSASVSISPSLSGNIIIIDFSETADLGDSYRITYDKDDVVVTAYSADIGGTYCSVKANDNPDLAEKFKRIVIDPLHYHQLEITNNENTCTKVKTVIYLNSDNNDGGTGAGGSFGATDEIKAQ